MKSQNQVEFLVQKKCAKNQTYETIAFKSADVQEKPSMSFLALGM